MTLGDDLQCGPIDELSDALRAIERLEQDLVDARGRIAAYESELRDYGQTVKRLNGELAEAQLMISHIGMIAAKAQQELAEAQLLIADAHIVEMHPEFHGRCLKENDGLRAELEAKRQRLDKLTRIAYGLAECMPDGFTWGGDTAKECVRQAVED